MPKKEPHDYNLRNKPLTTWLSHSQGERFAAIAKAHGVSIAAFLRSIVVDILDEEAQDFSLYLSPTGEAHYHAHLRLKSRPSTPLASPVTPDV